LIAVVLGGATATETAEQAASLLNRGFAMSGAEPPVLTALTTAATGPAVDMRAHGVCKEGVPTTVASVEGEGAPAPAPSALEPRFVLMPPVVVTTGGADARPAAKAAAARQVPLPRLRPAAASPATEDDAASG
jgi:hypothetical protein